MPKSIYLSVDLDYWKPESMPASRFPYRFLRALFESGKPLAVYTEHHMLLPHIRRHPADMLVNMDAHDDICIKDASTNLNCGTWACFVQQKNRQHYVWLHPYRSNRRAVSEDCGRCDPLCNVYRKVNNYRTGWKKVELRHRKLTKGERNRITGIGISISPEYCDARHLVKFLQLLTEYKLRITDAKSFVDRTEHSYSSYLETVKVLDEYIKKRL